VNLDAPTVARARSVAHRAAATYPKRVLEADDYYQAIAEKLIRGGASTRISMLRATVDLNRATHGRRGTYRAAGENWTVPWLESDSTHKTTALDILIAREDYEAEMARRERAREAHRLVLKFRMSLRDRRKYLKKKGKQR